MRLQPPTPPPYASRVSDATEGGIWSGREADVFWAYVHGEFSDATFAGYIATLQATFGPADRPSAMLTIAHSPRMPSASHRKTLAQLAESELGPRLRSHAIVSDSAIAQGVVTALNWLTRKPYEEKIFRTTAEALDWLRERHPRLNPGLWSTISARVPVSSRFAGR